MGGAPGHPPPRLSSAAEKELIERLTQLLNDSFGLMLCGDPLTVRSLAEIRGARLVDCLHKRIAVVGGSHAARLAAALESQGVAVVQVTAPGWRITRRSVGKVVEELTGIDPAPDCLIIQGLENSAYFCLGEDGTLCLPTRSNEDMKYHIIGELRVASSEQTLALLRLLQPLLAALPGCEKVVLSALPRYAHPDKPCCDNEEHLLGRGLELFEKVLADLSQMKKHVRSFIFKEKLEGVRVIDPIPLCEATDPSKFADPVHLAKDAYSSLAKNLLRILAGVEVPGADQPRGERANKRIRTASVPRGGVGGGARPAH